MPVKYLSNSSASITFQTVQIDLSTQSLKFKQARRCGSEFSAPHKLQLVMYSVRASCAMQSFYCRRLFCVFAEIMFCPGTESTP